MIHNAYMAKAPKSDDRHKPSRHVRVREQLAALLEQVAERRATTITTEANRAIRELLEREGLWPPPADGAGTSPN